LDEGELSAFVSKNVLAKEMGTDSPEVFNLSDVKDVDKLQYLSRYYDDVLKRFFNYYGQALQNQNKSAQSISDELHGMDSVSFIIPLQILNCRKALCQQINDIFGLDVDVDFSLAWKLEFDAFINRDMNDNDIPDIDEAESSADLPLESTEDINPMDDSTEEEKEDLEAKSEESEALEEDVDDPTDIPAMDLDPDESEADPEDEPEEKEGDEA
jgi:hypothetical protein